MFLKHAKAWGPNALRRVKIQEKTKIGEYLVADSVDAVEVGRGEHRGRIKLGMSGQVEIISGRESLLSILSRRARRSLSLG